MTSPQPSEVEQETIIRLGPPEPGGVFHGLSAGALVFLSAAAVVAVMVMIQLPDGQGLPVGAVLFAAAGGIVKVNIPSLGGTLFDQVPVLVAWWRRPKRWVPALPGGVLRRRSDGVRVIDTPDPPLPGGLAERCEILALPMEDGSEVAVAKDPKTGSFTVAMPVRASSFSMRSTGDQQRLFDLFGDAVEAIFTDPDSPVDRVGTYEISLPDPVDDLWSTFTTHPHTTELVGTAAHTAYARLLATAAPSMPEHEAFIAVRVNPAKGAGRRLVRAAGGGDLGGCVVAYDWASRLAQLLAAADGLQVAGCLPPTGLIRVLREAYDPGWREVGHVGRATSDRVPVSSGTDEHTDRLVVDSAVARTYEIAAWPQTPVGATFLMPLLLQSRAPRRVAVIQEPVDRKTSNLSLRVRWSTRKSEHDRRADLDRYDDGSFYDLAEHQRRIQDDIRRGAVEVRMRGYLTVLAPDDDQLDVACSNVTYAATRSDLHTVVMRHRQAEAFTYTLPLALGVPEMSPLRRLLGF